MVGWTLQLFKHIMEIDREVYWEFANVSCAGYPLKHIDTISNNGEVNAKSVLYKVVYGVRNFASSSIQVWFCVDIETEQIKQYLCAFARYWNIRLGKLFVTEMTRILLKVFSILTCDFLLVFHNEYISLSYTICVISLHIGGKWWTFRAQWLTSVSLLPLELRYAANT